MKYKLVRHYLYTPGDDYECPHEEVYDVGPIVRWELVPDPDITPRTLTDRVIFLSALTLFATGTCSDWYKEIDWKRGHGIRLSTVDDLVAEMLDRQIWDHLQQMKRISRWWNPDTNAET